MAVARAKPAKGSSQRVTVDQNREARIERLKIEFKGYSEALYQRAWALLRSVSSPFVITYTCLTSNRRLSRFVQWLLIVSLIKFLGWNLFEAYTDSLKTSVNAIQGMSGL